MGRSEPLPTLLTRAPINPEAAYQRELRDARMIAVYQRHSPLKIGGRIIVL